MLAIVIVALARSMPMLRMKSLILSFCWAKTCSTLARTADFLALALAVRLGIGWPWGFLLWTRLTFPQLASNASLAPER